MTNTCQVKMSCSLSWVLHIPVIFWSHVVCLTAAYEPLSMPHQFIHGTFILQLHFSNSHLISVLYFMHTLLSNCSFYPSGRGDHLLRDLGKQDSHQFECHLVSRLPQELLLHCVRPTPLKMVHQWHLPHSDLPPHTRARTHAHTQTHTHMHTCTYTYICHTLASFPGRLGLISTGQRGCPLRPMLINPGWPGNEANSTHELYVMLLGHSNCEWFSWCGL